MNLSLNERLHEPICQQAEAGVDILILYELEPNFRMSIKDQLKKEETQGFGIGQPKPNLKQVKIDGFEKKKILKYPANSSTQSSFYWKSQVTNITHIHILYLYQNTFIYLHTN